jgi:hypothetical protein
MLTRTPRLHRGPLGFLARTGLLATVAVASSWAMASALGSPAARAAEETLHYQLETTCTVRGGAPLPCTVEAVDEASGDVTIYRHTIGKNVTSIRVTDDPLTMSVMAPGSQEWVDLSSAGARFSTNTICFNERDLCVVNPNYLNSVREERPQSTAGRDLVVVLFDDDGRVNLTCYDDGCEGVLE